MKLIIPLIVVLFTATFVNGDERIIGGITASSGFLPHHVGLKIYTTSAHTSYTLCGGSILDRTHILTAAHCVFDLTRNRLRPFNQRFVDIITGTNLNAAPAAQSSEIFVHPSYRPFLNNRVDVAVIKLNNPLTFTSTVAPISLVRNGEFMSVGQQAIASGYGFLTNNGPISTSLQYTDITIVNDALCGGDNALNICGGGEMGRGVCFGDSGGALVVNTGGNNFVQIGITYALRENSLPTCGTQENYALFISLSDTRAIDFIDNSRNEFISGATRNNISPIIMLALLISFL